MSDAAVSSPQLCVGAVAVDGERLLLVRRAQTPASGCWSVPGGRVERGETLAEAVVREVAEETGLEVVCGEFLGWVERIADNGHYVILDFSVTLLDRVEPRPGGDASEAAWVPLSDVAELPLADGLAEFLHDHAILDVYA